MIQYATQFIPDQDINYFKQILQKKFLTQGPIVEKFEKKIRNICNDVKYSVSVNSASSGLHLSCKVLNLKKNDIVWTTPNTFAATANAAIHCDCIIDFVDIELNSFNLSVDALEKKLIKSKKIKKLPKALIVVHFAGNPCDMFQIKKFSKIYKFKIIEDASHALGARYKNSKVGDCKYSDLTVFSFHPVKIITTAEGGMITTNNKQYYERLKMFRTNGITRKISKKANMPSWYYEQQTIGYNYRMNEIQSALGIAQLRNLKNWIKVRNNIAVEYIKKLHNFSLKLPFVDKDKISSYHLFVVLLKNHKKINQLFEFLKKKKISCNLHYIPLYRHPYYKKNNFNFNDFPNTEYYYERAISLPMHVQLNSLKINFITKNIINFLRK